MHKLATAPAARRHRRRCGLRRRLPRTREVSEGRVGVAGRSTRARFRRPGFPSAGPRRARVWLQRSPHIAAAICASASPGSCSAARIRRGVRAGIDFVTEYGRDEVGALRKVPVNGADAHAGLLRDLSHGSVHSGNREHFLGRLEQQRRYCVGRRRARAAPCDSGSPSHHFDLPVRRSPHPSWKTEQNIAHLLTSGTLFRIFDSEHSSA